MLRTAILRLPYLTLPLPVQRVLLVSQDYEVMPAGPAVVMAHELGHNLGFDHDDELGVPCACDEPTTNCIMWSTLDTRLVVSIFMRLSQPSITIRCGYCSIRLSMTLCLFVSAFHVMSRCVVVLRLGTVVSFHYRRCEFKKNKKLCFCPHLRQMLIYFQNPFTVRLTI